MFCIENVSVKVDSKILLENISLSVEKKECNIIFGPNGSGKTSLIKAIMGIGSYQITKGRIILDKEDITKKQVDEKALLGIGIGFQQPIEIAGVNFKELLKICAKRDLTQEDEALIEKLNMQDHLQRDVNVNFSGGEKKRAEILQLLLMKPKVLILDEIDSGVDIESLALVGSVLNEYIQREKASCLIITHNGYILDYVKTKKACVLVNGEIHCYNKPKHIFKKIKKSGYNVCVHCEGKHK
jgi:Fe-S cluster assembly ATP-binding protein